MQIPPQYKNVLQADPGRWLPHSPHTRWHSSCTALPTNRQPNSRVPAAPPLRA